MPQETENTGSGLKGVTESVRNYVEIRLELFTLSITEQISKAIADSIQNTIGIILLVCGLLFAWIALGFFLAELLESNSIGFILASLPLLLGGIIFMWFKPKAISKKIQAGIMSNVLNSLNESGITIIESDNENEEEKE